MKLSVLKSLQFRMPLLVLSGIIPLITVSSFYATQSAAKQLNQEALENLALKSTLLGENIQNWNESNVLALLNLSRQLGIINPNPKTQETILAQTINTYQHFYLAHITNLEGWNIARSDAKKPKYYGDRRYFKNSLAGNIISYQSLIGRTSQKPSLCISTPNFKQSQIVGVTVACSHLNSLTEQVGKLRFGETGYAFLVDENGNLLVHPNRELLSGSELTNLSEYPPVKNILNNSTSNYFAFTDTNNVKWVSYSTRLNNGWAVVILQEEAEFLVNQKEFQNVALLISFVVILGTSILTFFLANRLIRPITYLSNAALTISKGHLEQKVNINRDDELGILASSFNHMASQLKKSFEELQQTFMKLETAKEEAISANLAKDKFLANISHEFRTPLNSVLGYAKLLQLDDSLSYHQIEQLTTIQKSGTYLLTLINDILDLSKSKAGNITLNLKEFDLLRTLKVIVRIVEREAQYKGLQIKTKFNNLPPTIRADQKRLTQILINLLNNAIKFTPKGQILFKVSLIETIKNGNAPLKQKIRFEVIDTGVGISEKQLKTIFQPFEQVGEMESKYLGTGLGLSISKQLLELMGGELKVKSQEGKGSNFWFELVSETKSQELINNVDRQPTLGLNSISGYKGRKRKLVVVDDRPENRLLLSNMLQAVGFEVLMAENGEKMFIILEKEQPDLILLDLIMPIKTGFTAARQLQQEPKFKDIPVIIVSACSITPEMRQYLKCDAFLNKPFEEEELFRLLAKYLNLQWTYRSQQPQSSDNNQENHPTSLQKV